MQKSIFVKVAQISRADISLWVKGTSGLLFILKIAHEDIPSFKTNLAFLVSGIRLVYFNMSAYDRSASCVYFVPVGEWKGASVHASSLTHSVTIKKRHIEWREEASGSFFERSSSIEIHNTAI